MLVFPQLSTGASALYPVIRKTRARTVVNELKDGSAVKFVDPDAGEREWELRASGLTEDEWTEIEDLFKVVAGRWKTFTFLDPAGNLVARSEEFSDSVWAKGALVTVTDGVADPLGTSRASRAVNGSGAVAGVTQSIAAPGWFRYSFSAWMRCTAGALVTLSATSGSLSTSRVVVVGPSWRRWDMLVALDQAVGSVVFGVQIPAGVTVDLFGAQVEAQPGVSDYKKTAASGGVYPHARFVGDELRVKAQGSDVFDAVVGIMAAN